MSARFDTTSLGQSGQALTVVRQRFPRLDYLDLVALVGAGLLFHEVFLRKTPNPAIVTAGTTMVITPIGNRLDISKGSQTRRRKEAERTFRRLMQEQNQKSSGLTRKPRGE